MTYSQASIKWAPEPVAAKGSLQVAALMKWAADGRGHEANELSDKEGENKPESFMFIHRCISRHQGSLALSQKRAFCMIICSEHVMKVLHYISHMCTKHTPPCFLKSLLSVNHKQFWLHTSRGTVVGPQIDPATRNQPKKVSIPTCLHEDKHRT